MVYKFDVNLNVNVEEKIQLTEEQIATLEDLLAKALKTAIEKDLGLYKISVEQAVAHYIEEG